MARANLNNVTTDTNITRQRNRRQYTQFQDLFSRTVKSYVEIRAYPSISAPTIDPDGSQPHKWRPSLAHYLCDIELATTSALNDSLDLQKAWFKLAADEDVPNEIAKQVIQRCGRVYQSRGLDPRQYFGFRYDGGHDEE